MAIPEQKQPFTPPVTVKHRGFFNFQEVITAIQDFFSENYYDTVQWAQYKFKIPSPAGAEYEIEVKGSRKVTEYVKFHQRVYLRVFDMREVEIVRDGKKVKTNDGRLHVEVKPTVEFDWQGRFKKGGAFGKFYQWLHDFFRGHIIKYKIEDYWIDNLLIEQGRLVKKIQATLGQEVM